MRAQLIDIGRLTPSDPRLGRYDNKDVGRILSEMDVLVVPSLWWENSPITIHEAFLTRTPVITAGIGGMW